jgi:hypothetical protein
MRKNLTLIIALLFLGNMLAKSAVFVDTLVVSSNGEHRLLIYIPDNYDAELNYSLVLGLQPCNGAPVKSYIDGLKPLTDSLNMIVAVPDNTVTGGWIVDADLDIITASIDSVMAMYSIDEKSVYFTGMSCNGEVALRQGLKKIYPFKGIFPWAPYISGVNSSIDLNSDMPITVAVGTKDEYSYDAILNLYDSLKTHGAYVNLVLVPGITHTFNFPNFGNEMIHSLAYLNDTNLISINYSESNVPNFEMMDTDPVKELVFKVFHKEGKGISINSLSSNTALIANPEIIFTESDSTVKIKFTPIAGKAGKVVIVLEAQEINGMAVEQITFKVQITKTPIISSVVESNNNSSLEVYPNPASNKISLKCEEENLSVQIFDMNGRIVLKTNCNTNSPIDISGLANGMYFLRAIGKNNHNTVKFTVN